MKSWRGLRRIVQDFRRHPWLHLISTSTITIALSLLGIFLIGYRNFEKIAERTNPSVSGTLYLREGLSDLEISALKDRILALENVQRVTFKSKEVVTKELSSFLGSPENDGVSAGELFPNILELEMKRDVSTSAVSIVKASLAEFPEITEADFSEDWLVQYKKIRSMLRFLGLFLIAGIVLGCAFLIANFMGMRHQQRKHEIDIVRLIGANRGFVLSPFLWEGLIEGMLGTLSALVFLSVLKRLIRTWSPNEWVGLLGIHDWLFLSPAQLAFFIVLGITMAFLGSIGVFLRFRESSIG